MNHQTEELLQQAKYVAGDESVFSVDQTAALMNIIDLIGDAIEKEVECNKRSY